MAETGAAVGAVASGGGLPLRLIVPHRGRNKLLINAWTSRCAVRFFLGKKLGRIPSCQTAAIDVLDRLLFNQILVFCAYSEIERDWLTRIMNGVINAVREAGATGLQKECLKHGVLCLMEILLSDDIDKLQATGLAQIKHPEGLSEEEVRRCRNYTRDYFLACVMAVLKKAHGNSMEPAYQIAANLAELFRQAPSTVRYRLTERCLVYEFQQAPLDCLSWLAKSEVIRSSKYPPDKLAELQGEAVFARIGLLCEFETLRNYIGRLTNTGNIADIALENSAGKLSEGAKTLLLTQKSLIDKQIQLDSLRNTFLFFDTERLRDKAYIIGFYTNASQFCTHFRIVKGTLAGRLGAIGAVMVEIDQSRHHTKTLYNELDNNGTITDDVAMGLLKRGFTINGRTLYDRHRVLLEKVLRQVRTYYQMLNANGVAISTQFEDHYYYGVVTNSVDL
ncbi:hypothetical protein [Sideroxydans sp.]